MPTKAQVKMKEIKVRPMEAVPKKEPDWKVASVALGNTGTHVEAKLQEFADQGYEIFNTHVYEIPEYTKGWGQTVKAHPGLMIIAKKIKAGSNGNHR
jgi:hypothetical protein